MCFSRKTTKCTGKHRDILQTFDKTIHITEILPTTVFYSNQYCNNVYCGYQTKESQLYLSHMCTSYCQHLETMWGTI